MKRRWGWYGAEIHVFTYLIRIEDIPYIPRTCLVILDWKGESWNISSFTINLYFHWILKNIQPNLLHRMQCIIFSLFCCWEGISQFHSAWFRCVGSVFDEWSSLCVSRREKLVTVSEQWELRQLASSHCSEPLPALARLYYCIVKTTLSECLECLISPFILAAQINTP